MNSFARKLAVVTVLAVAGFFAFAFFTGEKGWPAMMERREEMLRLEKQNEELRREIEKEREHLKSLAEDGAARERVVREKTNKQKREETTIYFGEQKAAPQQPSSQQPPAAGQSGR